MLGSLPRPIRCLIPALLLVATSATLAQGADEVQVLRARRELRYLSSNGNGASIYLARLDVSLRVKDLGYQKQVGIRFTTDEGKTFTDAPAYWVERFADGTEHWRVEADAGTLARNVRLGSARGDMGPAFARFSAYYRDAAGRTHWAGSSAAEHAVALLAPAPRALPQARGEPRTVLVDGALYLIGGRELETYRFTVPNVQRLEDDGRWIHVTDLPRPGASPSQPGYSPEVWTGFEVAAVGRRIYLFGGSIIRVGGRVTAVHAYDLDQKRWTTCAELPGALDGRRALVQGASVHLVPTEAQAGAAWVYDTTGDAWRQRPVGGQAQLVGSEPLSAVVAGKLYVTGGRLGAGQRLNDVFAYDPAALRYSRVGSLPVALSGGELAVGLGDQLLVANAEADRGRGRGSVVVYDPLANDGQVLRDRPLIAFGSSLAPLPPQTIGRSAGPARVLEALLVFDGTSRADVWEPVSAAWARGEARTTIRIQRDAGWGHTLTLRGSGAPLRWDAGVTCTWTPGNVWVYETTDLLLPELELKPLLDDRSWFPGANLRIRRGETRTFSFWSP